MFKFLKNISLYSFGEILNKSIQFLLLPLYAHYLSPSDYGKLELTYLYGAVLVIFYGLIIENGYSRLYFDKKEKLYQNTLFGTAFFFKIITGAVFLVISIIFSDTLAQKLFNFPDGALLIRLISISIFIKSIGDIQLISLIIEKRASRYVINNFIYLLVSLSSTVYFIVYMNLNIVGVLYGQILGAIVQFGLLIITEWKITFFSFSFELLRSMLFFSIFMIPSQLASFVTYWSNRIFLQEYTSLEDVGTFSFGYKIASIIAVLLTGPIKKAVGPEVFALIDDPENCKKRIRQFTLIILLLLSFFALMLSIYSKELILIMASDAYSTSHEVVFILCLGYVLIGLAGIVVLPINIVKKTWLITITWIISSIFNLALNYFLVPQYGKAGATYATLLTFLLILLFYFLFSEKVYKVGFEYFKYIMVIVIISLSYIISLEIHTNYIILNILFKSILLALTAFVLIRFILLKSERRFILEMIKEKFIVMWPSQNH